MRIQESICAFHTSDMVDRVRIFAEVLVEQKKSCESIAYTDKHEILRTVSLKRLPNPNERGHILSWSLVRTDSTENKMWHTIRKVTRKKLIFSWSTNISTVVYKPRGRRDNLRPRNETQVKGQFDTLLINEKSTPNRPGKPVPFTPNAPNSPPD